MQRIDSPLTHEVHALRGTVTAAVLDDGAVLLDLDSKYFYALNATGWAIAQLFEAGISREAATAQALAWGAPDDGSVDAFIAQFATYGLLEATTAEAVYAPHIDPPADWVVPTMERQAQPLQNVMVSAFDPSFPLSE